MNQEISEYADLLDTRDIIERIEWLESDEAKDTDTYEAKEIEEFAQELTDLMAFMDEMKGYGGDEQWRGDWYPLTLIADNYFEQYAQELAEEIGDISSEIRWPYTCIDWEKAARELQVDYSEYTFKDHTFWAR